MNITYNKAARKYNLKNITSLLINTIGMYIGAMTGFFYISYILCLVSAVIIVGSKEHKENIPYSIILLLVLQNFIIGTGAHFSGNIENLNYLTQVPFLYVVLVTVLIFDKKKIGMIDYFFLLLLTFIFLSIFFGRGPLESVLINIRNLTTFYFAYITGRITLQERETQQRFFDKTIKLGYWIILFGIVLLIVGYPLYKIIGIDEVYLAKGVVIDGRLDWRFGSDVFGIPVTRMGSLYYEPINMGYLLMSILLCVLLRDSSDIKKFFSFSIICIGLILTFAKGSLLIIGYLVLTIIIFKSYSILFRRVSKYNIYIITIFTSIFILIDFVFFYKLTFGGAVNSHFDAIEQTWRNIVERPLGHGIGTGGNANAIFSTISKEEWFGSGGETALLSFAYQIGLHSVVVLFIIFYLMGLKIFRVYYTNKNRMYLILSYLPIALFIISIMQDNTYTPQCITLAMLVLGGLTNSPEYPVDDISNEQNH